MDVNFFEIDISGHDVVNELFIHTYILLKHENYPQKMLTSDYFPVCTLKRVRKID